MSKKVIKSNALAAEDDGKDLLKSDDSRSTDVSEQIGSDGEASSISLDPNYQFEPGHFVLYHLDGLWEEATVVEVETDDFLETRYVIKINRSGSHVLVSPSSIKRDKESRITNNEVQQAKLSSASKNNVRSDSYEWKSKSSNAATEKTVGEDSDATVEAEDPYRSEEYDSDATPVDLEIKSKAKKRQDSNQTASARRSDRLKTKESDANVGKKIKNKSVVYAAGVLEADDRSLKTKKSDANMGKKTKNKSVFDAAGVVEADAAGVVEADDLSLKTKKSDANMGKKIKNKSVADAAGVVEADESYTEIKKRFFVPWNAAPKNPEFYENIQYVGSKDKTSWDETRDAECCFCTKCMVKVQFHHGYYKAIKAHYMEKHTDQKAIKNKKKHRNTKEADADEKKKDQETKKMKKSRRQQDAVQDTSHVELKRELEMLKTASREEKVELEKQIEELKTSRRKLEEKLNSIEKSLEPKTRRSCRQNEDPPSDPSSDDPNGRRSRSQSSISDSSRRSKKERRGRSSRSRSRSRGRSHDRGSPDRQRHRSRSPDRQRHRSRRSHSHERRSHRPRSHERRSHRSHSHERRSRRSRSHERRSRRSHSHERRSRHYPSSERYRRRSRSRSTSF
jgi:hypothetical protein